jgi:hypothetical protein
VIIGPRRLFKLPHKLALARPNSIEGTLSIELSRYRKFAQIWMDLKVGLASS